MRESRLLPDGRGTVYSTDRANINLTINKWTEGVRFIMSNTNILKEGSSSRGRSVTPTEPIQPQLPQIKLKFDSQTLTYHPMTEVSSVSATTGPIHHREFGNFLIQHEIARGGMGVVYKAIHKELNRVVALKCLKFGELASVRDIQRFQAEAEVAACLDHPNIVPVFEVGIHDGLRYYSMSYVDGETLSSKLVHGPWRPQAAAELTETLSRALAYAHQQGVIHRDLKPGNVLIDLSGQPRITDFGLAKSAREDSNITMSGEVVGTPKYAPPEQVSGRNHEITFASDIYSLGAILYCLLTGRPPFDAATAQEIAQQVLNCEPVLPRRLNPMVPKDLEIICLKCLQKTPSRRYSSASELADDLRRFLERKPIVARPVMSIERAWRWCRRNPAAAALTTLLVLVSAIGTSVSLMFAVRASFNAKEAQTNLKTANQMTKRLENEQRRTDQVLYHGQMQQAYWEWKLGNIRRLTELLDHSDKAYRDWEHGFLSNLPHRGHQTWSGHIDSVLCLAASPDGRTIASGGHDRTLRLWDISSGREVHQFHEHRGDVTCIAFSHDGHWLLSGSADKTIRIWDLRTLTRRRAIRTFGEPLKSLAITPDGNKVVVATADGAVRVYYFGSFEVHHTLQEPGSEANSVAISPDGTLVAAGFGDATVKLWELDTGAARSSMRESGGAVRCVSFDGSGKWLAWGCEAGDVKLWNISTSVEQHTLQGHSNIVKAIVFSRDSQRLVSCGADRLVSEWDVESGVLLRTLRGHSRMVNCVAIPDGSRRLISGSEDATVRIWDADTEQEMVTARGHTGWIDKAAFSPVQALVATTSADDTIRLWEVTTGKLVRTCQESVNRVEALNFTLDGSKLLCVDGDGQLHVIDVTTGETLEVRGEKHGCGAAAISPSSRLFVTGGSAHNVLLRNVEDGQLLAKFPGHTGRVECLALSPNEKWIASGSLDKTVRVWDVEKRQVRHVLNGHTKRPRSVAFDAAGKRLVTAGDDATVRIWDLESGRQLRELQGHGAYVRSAAFSPNGRRIVSASLDTDVKLWDAQTGDEILTLRGHRNAVLFVTFSPDGRHIASGASDHTLRLWDSGSSD